MTDNVFIDWYLLYETLRTNPVPWGRGTIAGNLVVLNQEQINHSTKSILQWGKEIYLKVQTIQMVQKAQRNALILEDLLDLPRGLDAWF